MSTERGIASQILTVSGTMIGICITVITIFKVSDQGPATYADELLSIASFTFILAVWFAYLAERHPDKPAFETIAEVCFFVGMGSMALVGAMLVYWECGFTPDLTIPPPPPPQ